MKPTSFKETNMILGAGNAQDVQDLPVCVALASLPSAGEKIPFVISRWKLSSEEIERIIQTGEIWISVMGVVMAPILPIVEHPFDDLHYEPLKRE